MLEAMIRNLSKDELRWFAHLEVLSKDYKVPLKDMIKDYNDGVEDKIHNNSFLKDLFKTDQLHYYLTMQAIYVSNKLRIINTYKPKEEVKEQ